MIVVDPRSIFFWGGGQGCAVSGFGRELGF